MTLKSALKGSHSTLQSLLEQSVAISDYEQIGQIMPGQKTMETFKTYMDLRLEPSCSKVGSE